MLVFQSINLTNKLPVHFNSCFDWPKIGYFRCAHRPVVHLANRRISYLETVMGRAGFMYVMDMFYMTFHIHCIFLIQNRDFIF